MPNKMKNAEKKVVRKKHRGQGAEIWARFCKNKGAMIGMAIVIMLLLLALFADVIFDYDTQIAGRNAKERLLPPSWEHPFGTDNMGRDLFCRVLYGTKYSFLIGVAATALSTLIAVPLGASAGYFGGTLEEVVMRFIDVLSSIPPILMGIVVVSALGASMENLIIAIGITGITGKTRMTRAAVLTVKNQEYVEAARVVGMREWGIILKHILPNCLSPIIVSVTLGIASAVVSASSLSFLGMGVPVPSPEWGALLSDGRTYIRTASHLTLFPGLAILVTVLAFNLMGDGLRDALDPKLRK